jgi:DUF4097 and DUF4098 domain-containing protein YvlB
MLAVVAIAGQGLTLAAAEPQDAPQREQRRIVISHELLMEIQQILRDSFGQDLGRDLRHELNHTLAEVMRELPQVMPGAMLNDLQGQERDFRAEQVDKQTRTLAIGPSGSLELRNIVGDIIVKAGASREATVEIVRTSRGRTDADAKLGLERVTVETSLQGTRGTVTARYPDERRPPYSVSTAYTVTVPVGARVAAHSISGNVRLTGVRGEVSADTISGDLDIQGAANLNNIRTMSGKITVTGAQSEGTIDVGTVSGSVNLTDVKARRVAVSAVSGPVVARNVAAASASVSSLSGDIDYAGPVSSAGRYEFQSHSGEIRLGLAGGFTFEGRSFSGNVQGDQGLSLTRSAGGRQVARGTQGDGSAVVAATTFSGNVRVSGK